MSYNLVMTYDIDIDEIICTKKLEDVDGLSIKYEAEAAVRPSKCTNPLCGHEIKPHVHSSSHNLIHDIKAHGKLVYIDLKIHRYRCPDCKYVFPDEFSFYEKTGHFTNRLKQEFVDRCIKGEPFNYIARDYSIDHKTVSRAFESFCDEHSDLFVNDYTPRILGIDEAHIDDHYRLVLTDVYGQRILDMKKNNKPATVNAYLRTLDKSICQAATMDFKESYASSVKWILPSTTIVIDKFHVIQDINKCLDHVRIDLQNKYREEKHIDISRTFKRSKNLFIANNEDLSEYGKQRLQKWFDDYPELYYAYMTKESFRDIYLLSESWGEASDKFNKWLKTIPPYKQFEPMKKTFTRRREHILNYFKYKWTNAYTESVNNQIKKIEKAGRGYKFDTLRKLCILEINTPKPDKFNPKTATFVDTETGEIIPSEAEIKARDLYAGGIKAAEPEPLKSMKWDFTFAIPPSDNPEGILKESLEIYLDVFDREKYEESFNSRMLVYYKAIQELWESRGGLPPSQ